MWAGPSGLTNQPFGCRLKLKTIFRPNIPIHVLLVIPRTCCKYAVSRLVIEHACCSLFHALAAHLPFRPVPVNCVAGRRMFGISLLALPLPSQSYCFMCSKSEANATNSSEFELACGGDVARCRQPRKNNRCKNFTLIAMCRI